MISTYDKQAQDFLELTATEFRAEFIEHGLYFASDKEKRDIYQVTLKRGGREFSFRFGQSITHSGRFTIIYPTKKYPAMTKLHSKEDLKKARSSYIGSGYGKFWDENKDFEEPTPYSVLACLTKYDPGTFEDFCGNFGCDTDSRQAEKTYKAVVNEWQNICMLYNDAEIAQLAEIN